MIDVATARWVVTGDCGAIIVVLQAGAVVGDMDVDGVVWLVQQTHSLNRKESQNTVHHGDALLAVRCQTSQTNNHWDKTKQQRKFHHDNKLDH